VVSLRVEAAIVADAGNSERERRFLVRAFRQELESLARAGLDRVPAHACVTNQPKLADMDAASMSAREENCGETEIHASEISTQQSYTKTHRDLLPPGIPQAGVPALTRPAPALMTVAPPSSLLGPLLTESGFETPPFPVRERQGVLDSLAGVVAGCRKCAYLAETRTQTVFGTGPAETRLMFVGEAPGADEDRQGKPFVGRAGQLLTDMITKGMGLTREQVYIANVLKCRPPENRTPTELESDNCIGYLEEQIAIIRPEFICLLGRVALQGLLKSSAAMGKARGKWYYYKGIPTMVTYHPSYLLRKPDAKRDVWQDLQMLMKEMGLKPPERKGREG
jgi:uracil-DNA glycosylase